MRKIYSILTLALFLIIVSCTDDSLDPLQFKKVSKGTILALRGDFLNAIYFDGVSGASFVPLIANGTEKFTYEAEFLSDNPSLLESIDVYAEDSVGVRTLLKNFPASAFTTGENGRPMITVSFTLAEILPKIGIDVTSFPMDQATVDAILGDNPELGSYASGINIVTDINLTDGTKVLAEDMVAAGLYQSNQFYPAMRLPFDVVRYCRYEDNWAGDYKGLEIADETNGPYDFTFTQTDDNTYHAAGIFGPDGKTKAIEFDVVFSPSTTPYDQDIADITATVGDTPFEGVKGSYNQCTHVITFEATLGEGDDAVEWTYQFTKK